MSQIASKQTALVVTSISKPNPVLKALAAGALKHDWNFFCIGDKKSPADFKIDGCTYFSHQAQTQSGQFKISQFLPDNHYARKNFGYLEAITSGAEFIVETDDDNFPLDTFWEKRSANVRGYELPNTGDWVNMYRYFSAVMPLWPRGIPLQNTSTELPALPEAPNELISPIQQGLANGNPDVDAIYRLVCFQEIEFNELKHPIALSDNWCPFNSQNTTWEKQAFKLLYLPTNCSFRMTDIWRSFIALRCSFANDWPVLFHNATVFQERNEHNLMRDFEDEIPGYMNNTLIKNELEKLNLLSGVEHLSHNIELCYEKLISIGLVSQQEEPILQAWLQDCDALGI